MSAVCISVTVRQTNVVPAHGGKVVPAAGEHKPQCSSTCHALACTQLLHYIPLATANHLVKSRLKGGRDRLHDRGTCILPSIGVRKPTV